MKWATAWKQCWWLSGKTPGLQVLWNLPDQSHFLKWWEAHWRAFPAASAWSDMTVLTRLTQGGRNENSTQGTLCTTAVWYWLATLAETSVFMELCERTVLSMYEVIAILSTSNSGILLHILCHWTDTTIIIGRISSKQHEELIYRLTLKHWCPVW